ncbi:MAG TPA: flagellin, partial [Burkholderiaceae bacterium]|nr:flagellin [Burkholderiaceae bacterium]
MAQVINTNLPSLNAQRNLSTTQTQLAQSIQRLSSGLRVNSAKDDAAGLAIAERMQAQVRGMNVAIRNANDGISMAQVAEGALGKVSDILQRMRELATQSANGTYNDADRSNLDTEYQLLADEIDRIFASTRFNGLAMLGADAGSLVFQIGANTGAENQVSVTSTRLDNAAATTAVTGAASEIGTAADSRTAMTNIDALLDIVTTERAKWGAVQNRFEAVISTLQVSAENQEAARSRIMDADFAKETAELTRAQILQQA